MSPLWRDEIGVHLSPQRLCAVRLQRGLRPRQVATHEQALAGRGEAWGEAVEKFAQLLALADWSGVATRVVIADHWARYCIVPWVGSLNSESERLAYGRQLLTSSYGESIADWEVRVSAAPPQRDAVACAVPRALIAALRAACASQGIGLLSLQPQLIAAYAAWRDRLPDANAWFVSIEPGSLAAAHVGAHGWDRVYSVRIGVDWLRELKRLQTFGRLASSSPGEGNVYVDAPHAWRTLGSAVEPTSGSPEASALRWLDEESGPVSTLQRLNRARRLAA